MILVNEASQYWRSAGECFNCLEHGVLLQGGVVGIQAREAGMGFQEGADP